MRELKECTVEVFRRSEQRIKARRRNRNRVLALCIPVCLIAAIWPVMKLPAAMRSGEAGNRAPLSGEALGNAPGSFACPNEDGLAAPPIDFDAQCIRTDGYREDAQYPAVRIIRSVRELTAYYEANKEEYDLERKDNAYSDMTAGFLDACDRYDGAYFEDHILIMVLLEEGSGSVRHKVQSVHMSAGGRCCVYIDRVVPEVGTDDMAEWHILIEPEAGVEIEAEADITVFVDGINPLTQPPAREK